MRDSRDPQKLGSAIQGMKNTHPQATACERADMMEEWYDDIAQAYVNGQMNFMSRNSSNGAAKL